jgi:hypothetical protein
MARAMRASLLKGFASGGLMHRAFGILVVATLFSAPALADERKQDLLHVDSGFGGSWAYGMNAFGIHGVVEPKIFILDELAVGLRIDGGAQFGLGIDTSGDGTQVEGVLHIPVAELVKAEYYLGKDGFRPFVGAGVGNYTMVLQAFDTGSQIPQVSQGVGNFLGVAPQIGLDFGGVRLAATYNFILGGEIIVNQAVGDPIEFRRDYLGVELTFKTWGFSL